MTAREIAVRVTEEKRQGKTVEFARVCLCRRCEAGRKAKR